MPFSTAISVRRGTTKSAAYRTKEPVAGRERRGLDRAAEPPDQVAGEVLQRRLVPAAAVVRPVGQLDIRHSPSSTSSSLSSGTPSTYQSRTVVHTAAGQRRQVDPVGDDRVLDVSWTE